MSQIRFFVVTAALITSTVSCKSTTTESKGKDVLIVTDQGYQFLAKTQDNQYVCLRSCFDNETPNSANGSNGNTVEVGSTCKTIGAQRVSEFSIAPDGFDKNDWSQFANTVLDTSVLAITDKSKDKYRYVEAAVARFDYLSAKNCENYSAAAPVPSARSSMQLSGSDTYRFAVSSYWKAPRNEYYYVHLYADFWNPDTQTWSGTKHWKITAIHGKYVTLTNTAKEVIGGRTVNAGNSYIQSNYWCRNWFTTEEDYPGVKNGCYSVESDAAQIKSGIAYFNLGGPK